MQEIKEEWRDIPGYEGLYQASTHGRIASYNYKNKGEWHILRLLNLTKGYKGICLYKDNIGKTLRVHRLIAMTFIPNPDNLPIINHKDENPSNNHVDNLEWCTYKYNSNYKDMPAKRGARYQGENHWSYGKHHTEEWKEYMRGKMLGRIISADTKEKMRNAWGKKWIIRQISTDGNIIAEYRSSHEASKFTGIGDSRIRACCRGVSKTAGGYHWKRIYL